MSETKAKKSTKIETAEEPKLVGFSFYHKGVEYVIQAVDANKARALFNQLLQSNG